MKILNIYIREQYNKVFKTLKSTLVNNIFLSIYVC